MHSLNNFQDLSLKKSRHKTVCQFASICVLKIKKEEEEYICILGFVYIVYFWKNTHTNDVGGVLVKELSD